MPPTPSPNCSDHPERTHKMKTHASPLTRLLWAWKALPVGTRRKRFADALWFALHGDEASADAALR